MSDADTQVEKSKEEATKTSTKTISDETKSDNINKSGIDTILNINVTLSIQVGTTRMKLKDLLKLSKGTVIELNKMAGEPLDILVNDVLIAHGEVVVVNDKYGIRLTEVTSESERFKPTT